MLVDLAHRHRGRGARPGSACSPPARRPPGRRPTRAAYTSSRRPTTPSRAPHARPRRRRRRQHLPTSSASTSGTPADRASRRTAARAGGSSSARATSGSGWSAASDDVQAHLPGLGQRDRQPRTRAPTRSTPRSRWAVGVDDSGVMQYFVRFTQGPTGAAIGFHSIPTQERRAAADRAPSWARRSRTAASGRRTPDAIALWNFAPDRHQGRRRRLTAASATRSARARARRRRRRPRADRRRRADGCGCPRRRSSAAGRRPGAPAAAAARRRRPARRRGCASATASRRARHGRRSAAGRPPSSLRGFGSTGAGSTMRPLVPGRDAEVVEEVLGGRVGLLRLVEGQVERLVDHLPAVQVGPVDERDRDAGGAGAAGAADPVDVGLLVLGAGVVDDVGDALRRRCRGRRRRWRPAPGSCPRGTWSAPSRARPAPCRRAAARR